MKKTGNTPIINPKRVWLPKVDVPSWWNGYESCRLKEIGKDSRTGNILVRVDKKYFRPTEVDILLGDYSKAKKKLKWSPKISFTQLVKEMVNSEIKKIS